jgi:hypothetical protein
MTIEARGGNGCRRAPRSPGWIRRVRGTYARKIGAARQFHVKHERAAADTALVRSWWCRGGRLLGRLMPDPWDAMELQHQRPFTSNMDSHAAAPGEATHFRAAPVARHSGAGAGALATVGAGSAADPLQR